jgi:hypothetical protein
MLTHCLTSKARADTPLVLDAQAGSQVCGAVVGVLWERFCANKATPACAYRACDESVVPLPTCESHCTH